MEKVAVVLVENFSAKLVVASVVNNNYFVACDTETKPINLDVESDGEMFLKKNQIDNTIKVLKNFRKICEMHQVGKVFAVSTFTEEKKPKNIYSFFEEVFNTCGFRFVMMSEEEHNEAMYNGIINSFDIPKGVICRITAQSVHIVVYNRRVIVNQCTLPFGSQTLADKFPLEEALKQENLENMVEFVNAELSKLDFLNSVEDEYSFIGYGNYYKDMSTMVKKLKKYPLDNIDNYIMGIADCNKVLNQISALDLDKSKKIKGVGEARADMFVSAMIINQCLAKKINRENVIVSTKGIVEGILFSQVVEMAQEKPISDVLGYCVAGQSLAYNAENVKHDEQVYNLSMLLFKQLRVLHKLPRNYTKILRLASFMHDCGRRIGNNNNSKNGFNVLVGADINGVTHRELVLAGFAVALHCGADVPVSEFIKYHELISEEDISAVKKLGIIVRLAEAFDRTKNNVIVDINCDILGDSVIMKTIAVGDNSYEIEKASECARDFEKNFGKKIEIL